MPRKLKHCPVCGAELVPGQAEKCLVQHFVTDGGTCKSLGIPEEAYAGLKKLAVQEGYNPWPKLEQE